MDLAIVSESKRSVRQGQSGQWRHKMSTKENENERTS